MINIADFQHHGQPQFEHFQTEHVPAHVIVVKKDINQAAGYYIRSHEEVQRVCIRNRLNQSMNAHGSELIVVLASNW